VCACGAAAGGEGGGGIEIHPESVVWKRPATADRSAACIVARSSGCVVEISFFSRGSVEISKRQPSDEHGTLRVQLVVTSHTCGHT
jgi:hypothetical protein